MASRKRNYKAEEARRNEIARSLGYKNRAEMRRAIETGKIAPRKPKAIRSPRTIAAQKLRVQAEQRGYKPTTYDEIISGTTLRQRNEDWAAQFARTDVVQINTDGDTAADSAKQDFIKQHGRKAYDEAYYKAFVSGAGRYKETRRKGGSYELFYWFVVVTQYMTADEYESRYGPLD